MVVLGVQSSRPRAPFFSGANAPPEMDSPRETSSRAMEWNRSYPYSSYEIVAKNVSVAVNPSEAHGLFQAR